MSSTCSSRLLTCRYQTTGGWTVGVAPGGHDRGDEPVVGHVLGQGLADPVVEGERAGLRERPEAPLVAEDGRPLHREQVGILGPLEQAVDPARPLVGLGARSRARPPRRASGSTPQMSSDERRANSPSVQAAAGARLRLAELAEDEADRSGCPKAAAPTAGGSSALGIEQAGDRDLAAEPRHDRGLAHAVERLDQPVLVDRRPGRARSTRYCARRVTSTVEPSAWCATTRSCCVRLRGSTRCVGPDRDPRPARGSSPAANGMPWPIQRAIVRYSGEPIASRLPPPWAIAAVGLSSIRLAPGAAGKTRRPRPSRTRLS